MQNHRRFQRAVRDFVKEVVFPDAQAREEDGQTPSKHVVKEMARLNIIAMRLGPGQHLHGRILMDGLVEPQVVRFPSFTQEYTYLTPRKPKFDCFHELILNQELARIHARGYSDGLGGGTCIGLPPVMNFGKPALRDKIVAEVLGGEKFISLAVTEAFAGSDVSGIKCHAKKVEGAWVVNGSTDAGAVVVLLVPRGPGVTTRPILTSYSITAGTAYVTFDDVHVPEENLLGKEDGGLQVVLSNFNHERWGLTCGVVSAQRAVVEECLKWVTQREVFGKSLSSQAVVRSKIAAMIARVESCQSWLESITFQMTHMNYREQSTYLAG
ncbi:hypothetical protein H0H81_005400 [Sphagnurus paluster]|uniref:Acyl-CoA dehydrogenase n=1 Tax=Sphagnurus paluster TaxID=117069 RepID=A0A9P7GSV2_9AGAR|nr:hypothetical protein H0H81_005400 [Sphagnurus paluster]